MPAKKQPVKPDQPAQPVDADDILRRMLNTPPRPKQAAPKPPREG